MAIEILGFIVKPEISIGDIVATIGLIATAVIFYISYRRTRRNDQLELFIERYRRLDELYEELKIYAITKIDVDDKWDTLPDEEKVERITVLLSRFHIIHNDIAMLTYLKLQRDLSPEITELIAPSAIIILKEMKKNHDTWKENLKDEPKLLKQLDDDDFEDLKEEWQFDGQSKPEGFFGRLKEVFHLQ